VKIQFLLAANGRLKSFATQCVKSLDVLGYQWTMFDLGGLGFGHSYPIKDETFQSQGYYQTIFSKRPSCGMHKPQIIADFLNTKFSNNEPGCIVYLDADTFIRQKIDEIIGNYDIGVTVRRACEWERHGKVNAGVLFFRSTMQTRIFVNRWIAETQRLGNDQEALNSLLLSEQQCIIAEFPTDIYNWYYFPTSPPKKAKILHFKASAPKDSASRSQTWISVCKS
jgi:hypothetical protein